VPRTKAYLLTPTARRQLREARAWSLARSGRELTEAYFIDLDAAARDLAKNYRNYRTREELAGGTGLLLHPVREHYLVYEPLTKNQIIIVAVVRQSRDISSILAKGKHLLVRELQALKTSLA
jgi:plasmid stabilization system protein ParE